MLWSKTHHEYYKVYKNKTSNMYQVIHILFCHNLLTSYLITEKGILSDKQKLFFPVLKRIIKTKKQSESYAHGLIFFSSSTIGSRFYIADDPSFQNYLYREIIYTSLQIKVLKYNSYINMKKIFNLQVQCKPYQIIDVMFHRTRTTKKNLYGDTKYS